MAKRIDAAKAKQKKQKILVAVLGVVLLATSRRLNRNGQSKHDKRKFHEVVSQAHGQPH